MGPGGMLWCLGGQQGPSEPMNLHKRCGNFEKSGKKRREWGKNAPSKMKIKLKLVMRSLPDSESR